MNGWVKVTSKTLPSITVWHFALEGNSEITAQWPRIASDMNQYLLRPILSSSHPANMLEQYHQLKRCSEKVLLMRMIGFCSSQIVPESN
jgi:hypothetical protein